MSGLATTIAQQASIIEAVLNDWAVSQNNGTADVVGSLTDLWDNSAINTDSFRVLICYEGETVREAFPVAAYLHRVDRRWIVRVTRGRGLSAQRGDGLTKTVGNAIPFWDGVEACRDNIRTITNICPADELPVDFKSMEMRNTTVDGMVVDDCSIRFSNGIDLPNLSLTGTPPT